MANKKLKRGRPKIIAPCVWCGKPMATGIRKAHEPKCPKRPKG